MRKEERNYKKRENSSFVFVIYIYIADIFVQLLVPVTLKKIMIEMAYDSGSCYCDGHGI